MSPSASNMKRSCSSINHCSWHIDHVFQAATVRPSVNQVDITSGLRRWARDRGTDRLMPKEGYLDDFCWFIEAPSTKLQDASLCSREQCVLGWTHQADTRKGAVVPAVIDVIKVGQLLPSRPAPHGGAGHGRLWPIVVF